MTILLSLISLPHAFEYIKNVNQFAIRSFNSIQFITQKLNICVKKISRSMYTDTVYFTILVVHSLKFIIQLKILFEIYS